MAATTNPGTTAAPSGSQGGSQGGNNVQGARGGSTPARELMAVIGDEDSVTGMLLAGVGQVEDDGASNYLVVGPRTTVVQIEDAFRSFTETRRDIAIVLITQQAANEIRHLLDAYSQVFPTILEIPSKDTPYDPSKDSVLRRVQRLAGN